MVVATGLDENDDRTARLSKSRGKDTEALRLAATRLRELLQLEKRQAALLQLRQSVWRERRRDLAQNVVFLYRIIESIRLKRGQRGRAAGIIEALPHNPRIAHRSHRLHVRLQTRRPDRDRQLRIAAPCRERQEREGKQEHGMPRPGHSSSNRRFLQRYRQGRFYGV